ncbi:MAG: hypothetical protein KDA51_05265, partial [Planctomycetales bacterium]|nr:hypothetical protein [Planctomycetales bacterium]
MPTSRPPLSSEATELLPALASENGAVRDLALQAIMNSTHADLIKDVRRMAWEHPHPTAAVRAAALGCLAAKGWLDSQDCQQMLSDPDPRVVRLTLEMLESLASRTSELDLAIADVPRRNLGREVDLQWILTSTLLNEFDGSSELAALAARCEFDPWILRALSLVHGEERVVAVVKPLLQLANADDATAEQYAQLEKTLESLWGRLSSKDQLALQSDQLPSSSTASDRPFQRSELLFLALSKQKGTANDALNAQVQDLVERAQVRLTSDAVPDQERLGLVNLIGSGLVGQDKQLNIARSILQKQASVAVKRAVIESLRRASKQEVADILLECWPEMTSSLRSAATTTLLTRREWVVALVDRLETGS